MAPRGTPKTGNNGFHPLEGFLRAREATHSFPSSQKTTPPPGLSSSHWALKRAEEGSPWSRAMMGEATKLGKGWLSTFPYLAPGGICPLTHQQSARRGSQPTAWETVLYITWSKRNTSWEGLDKKFFPPAYGGPACEQLFRVSSNGVQVAALAPLGLLTCNFTRFSKLAFQMMGLLNMENWPG